MKTIKSMLLYLSLLVIMTALLLAFILLPLISNIKVGKQQLAEKQTKYNDEENRVVTLKSLEKNKDDLQTKIDRINNLWPDDKEVSNFIVNLEGLANQQNITLKNVAISESTSSSASKSDKKVKKIQFSFDTQTTFNQNLAIIKSMEKFSRFNAISQINFTKDNDGSILMKITGSIYYGQ